MAEFKCRNCGKTVTCERLEDVPTLPFCSERCKLIDLGKWADEEFRIAGEPAPEDEQSHDR